MRSSLSLLVVVVVAVIVAVGELRRSVLENPAVRRRENSSRSTSLLAWTRA